MGAILRFDYSGHGESSGAFTDGSIGDWAKDAEAAITELTEGPQILMGSSMGGWISLLMSKRIPDCIAGLATIAAAPDFTKDIIHHRCEDIHRRCEERRRRCEDNHGHDEVGHFADQVLAACGLCSLFLLSNAQEIGELRWLIQSGPEHELQCIQRGLLYK